MWLTVYGRKVMSIIQAWKQQKRFYQESLLYKIIFASLDCLPTYVLLDISIFLLYEPKSELWVSIIYKNKIKKYLHYLYVTVM